MTDMDIKPDINESTAQFSDSADNNYGYPLGNNATSGETTGENRMIVTDCSDQQDQNSGVDSVVKTEVETETEGEQVDAGSASSARSSQSDSSSGSKSAKSNDQMDYVVKLRGLPWSCTKDDVVDFLGCKCFLKSNLRYPFVWIAQDLISGISLITFCSRVQNL